MATARATVTIANTTSIARNAAPNPTGGDAAHAASRPVRPIGDFGGEDRDVLAKIEHRPQLVERPLTRAHLGER